MAALQLHQLLAIIENLAKKAGFGSKERTVTFGKKPEHFDGWDKNYKITEEGTDDQIPESKEMVTTVDEQLDYLEELYIPWLDADLQKEETNSGGDARAELIINDTSFGKFSATTLLAWEKHIKNLVEVYKTIPTLDPVRRWELMKQMKEKQGVFKTPEEVRIRTVKKAEVLLMAPATDKHPAQTELIHVDKQVGKWLTTYYSGKWTPRKKAEVLNRLENVLVTVKKARSEANKADVVPIEKAEQLFHYIREGTTK
jgi:hypothetical protein